MNPDVDRKGPKSRHILLIHQAFTALDEPGGTRHHELASYLARMGERVTIIGSPISYLTGKRESDGGVQNQDNAEIKILRAYTYPALHKSFVHRMVSFFSFMLSSFFVGLKVRKVDLVWGTSPPIFQAITAWALARLKGVPFLFEVRDLWPDFAIAVGVLRQPILIRMSRWLERFLYTHADCLIINSPGFEEHVRSKGAKKIVVLPNGADIEMFDPHNDGFAFAEIHELHDKFVVLYAGAHGMSNDLGVLIEAAGSLLGHPQIQIVLLGDGKEKAALQDRVREMGLPNVRFIAPVPKNEIAVAIAAAQVCVAILKPIELYKTVYPNKVFDYMAAGRPVVLAIDGVIRDVVERASAGIAVPPGKPKALADAILQLFEDRPLAEQMGLNGREYLAKHFNRAELANKLHVLMGDLIGKSD